MSSNKGGSDVGQDRIHCQLSRRKELVRRGRCSSLSNQDFRRSTAKHYSKKSELIYNPKKDAYTKCLSEISAKSTEVCSFLAILRRKSFVAILLYVSLN